MAPWAKNAKGILESWLLGQSGGPALADVLFGKVSLSGKLAQTIPFATSTTIRAPSTGRAKRGMSTTEGVFVGYRYYDTYNKDVDYPVRIRPDMPRSK